MDGWTLNKGNQMTAPAVRVSTGVLRILSSLPLGRGRR